MSSRTYICLPCRWSRRASAWPKEMPRCVQCRRELERLDRRWRIPAKDNPRGWKRLVEAIARDAAANRTPRPPLLDPQLNALDRQITNAGTRPDSARLYWRLRRLRQKRRRLLRRS